jgi:hypothetical protein
MFSGIIHELKLYNRVLSAEDEKDQLAPDGIWLGSATYDAGGLEIWDMQSIW